jgi:predicted MFS family arabinose efflux permease
MVLQYAVGGAFLPFASLYLRDQGLSYSQMGWIYLASCAAGALMPFLWGYIADQLVSVERLLAILHTGGAVALLLFSLQRSFWGILIAFAAYFGLNLPTSALLSALAYHNLPSPDAQFGRLRLWGSVGWMLPSLPIYSWLAFKEDLDLHFINYLAAGLAMVLVGITFFLPRTPPLSKSASLAPADALPYRAALLRLFRKQGFGLFLLIVFLMHSSFVVLFHYSSPFLEDLGFPRKWLGPIQCVGVMVEIPFFFILPVSLRRLGYFGTIVVGAITLFLRQVLYSSCTSSWLLVGSYLFAGLCVVFYLTGVSLAINAMADRSIRATAQTLLWLMGPGLGQMLGHRAVGSLATRAPGGLRPAFEFAAVTAGIALLILVFGLRGKGVFSRGQEGITA